MTQQASEPCIPTENDWLTNQNCWHMIQALLFSVYLLSFEKHYWLQIFSNASKFSPYHRVFLDSSLLKCKPISRCVLIGFIYDRDPYNWKVSSRVWGTKFEFLAIFTHLYLNIYALIGLKWPPFNRNHSWAFLAHYFGFRSCWPFSL